MRRHKHSLSHYVLSTFDMGELVPVANFEVLPGDSVRMSTSCLLRFSPLATPVMHPISVRIHHWFVPYRLLWDNWEEFITGGPDGNNASVVPTQSSATNVAGSVLPYFGLPTRGTGAGFLYSALPNRAYVRIWNENYRDQDLQTEATLSLADGNDNTTDQNLQGISWEKDAFTAARPWTQKGSAVSIPVQGVVSTASTDLVTGAQNAMRVLTTAGANLGVNVTLGTSGVSSGAEVGRDTVAGFASDGGWYPTNLQVASANASVNQFRLAFALQRYKEARAQFGSRYTEYLRYLGVRSSDARLQRPEYLGGGRSTVSFSEVLRTATTAADTSPVGDMFGHGISALRSRRWIRFFEEHGIVMTLASIRPRTMYVDGQHKKWNRSTKEMYWQKELEQIGQQEVFNREVWGSHTTLGGVFGYNDRYYDYRHHPSYVCGDFKTTLNDWHFGRIFAADPVLNGTFIRCTPGVRPFADQTSADKIWGMFSHSIQARRMVSNKVIGRIV